MFEFINRILYRSRIAEMRVAELEQRGVEAYKREAELEKQLADCRQQLTEKQQEARLARAVRDNAETRKAWLNAEWQALRPQTEREKILQAFRENDRNHPLVAAMRMILESTYEEAVSLSMAPEMSDKPGQLAHAAGGAYWLALLNERLRDAIIEAQRNPRINKEPT